MLYLIGVSQRCIRTIPRASASGGKWIFRGCVKCSTVTEQKRCIHILREGSAHSSANAEQQITELDNSNSFLWTSFSFLAEQTQHIVSLDVASFIFLFGALLRFCTLFFSLYGERATARMIVASSELKEAHAEYLRISTDPLASALTRYTAFSAYKVERRQMFKKHQTSHWKCLVPLWGSPIIAFGFSSVVSLCDHPRVQDVPVLWCRSVAAPDATLILPALCSLLTLLNFEFSLTPTVKEETWVARAVAAGRVVAVCAVPLMSFFPSGACLFVLGMNSVGLLQPLLIRSKEMRKCLGFPLLEDGKKNEETSRCPRIIPARSQRN